MSFDDHMLRDMERRIDEQLQQAQQLQAQVESTKVRLASRDGEVLVTLNSSGGLADLRLSPQAMRLTADELSAVVMDTSRRAQAKLAERMKELATSVYGSGSETAELISSVYAVQYPPQPADDVPRERGDIR